MSEKYKLFQWCPVQQKVVPIHEVKREYQSFARDLFIQDEMAPTRNPLNPKEIYTSKSKLRAAYRTVGAVEIGDAYDRGYSPDINNKDQTDKVVSQLMKQVRERLNG